MIAMKKAGFTASIAFLSSNPLKLFWGDKGSIPAWPTERLAEALALRSNEKRIRAIANYFQCHCCKQSQLWDWRRNQGTAATYQPMDLFWLLNCIAPSCRMFGKGCMENLGPPSNAISAWVRPGGSSPAALKKVIMTAFIVSLIMAVADSSCLHGMTVNSFPSGMVFDRTTAPFWHTLEEPFSSRSLWWEQLHGLIPIWLPSIWIWHRNGLGQPMNDLLEE